MVTRKNTRAMIILVITPHIVRFPLRYIRVHHALNMTLKLRRDQSGPYYLKLSLPPFSVP